MKTRIKSLLIVALAGVMASVCCCGVMVMRASAMEESECDRVFYEAFDGILDKEGVYGGCTVSKEIVYDIMLAPLGYVYGMAFDDRNGYAIVIDNDGVYDMTEFLIDAQSPFADADGKKIYVALNTYLIYDDGSYRDIKTGTSVADDAIASLAETAFLASYCSSDGHYTYETETISFVNRAVTDEYKMAFMFPSYLASDVYSNSCAVSAGATILGYYDRYCTNLIPDFTPGSALGNYYAYNKNSGTQIETLIADLYAAMSTDSVVTGTTIPQYRSGMTSYVNGKGYDLTFNSCMLHGEFDYAFAKFQMKSGFPVSLFMTGYNFALISSGDTDFLQWQICPATHVMSGFGYQTIAYTLTDGSSRTDDYISVATGYSDRPRGYYNLDYLGHIDQALAVDIS